MYPNNGWCNYCKTLTFLKEVGCEKEDVAGNVMTTREYAGKCSTCKRNLRKVIVEVTEEDGKDE